MNEIIHRLLLLALIAFSVISLAACAKPKAELMVSRTQIKQGESVSLNWKTMNAKEVLLNGEKVGKTGSQVAQPNTTTTYELIGRSGKKEAKDSKQVTVEVLPAAPVITLTADPPAITAGDRATLRWSSQRAEKVEIPGVGTFGPSGETTITPKQSLTYTATAKGPGGDASASARVTVTERVSNNTTTTNPRPDTTTVDQDAQQRFAANVKSIYFDFDKSDLRPEARTTLDNNARFLSGSDNNTIVFRIEGNCDPRGSEEYNLALGDRRANEAKTYLVSKGIDPARMDVISNGKRNAAGTSEGSPEVVPSWAHDRRGDFRYVRTNIRPAPVDPAPVTPEK
jgi:peptidoglycan-associated lipoprotein